MVTKFTTTLLLVIAFTFSAISQSLVLPPKGENQKSINKVFSKPKKSKDYWWGAMGGTAAWNNTYNSTYYYNIKGLLTAKKSVSSSSGKSWDSISNTYDSKDRLIANHYMKWDLFGDGSRYDVSKFKSTYDANDNETEYKHEAYKNGWYVTKNSYKCKYTYINTNQISVNLMQIYDSAKQVYVDYLRETYKYANNQISEIKREVYTNGAWVENHQEINIVWSDYAKKKRTSYTVQIYDATKKIYNDYKRYEYTYLANGCWTRLEQNYAAVSSKWKDYIKYFENYDSDGKPTDARNEFFNSVTWITITTTNYTYVNGNLTLLVYVGWDGKALLNENKYEYTDWIMLNTKEMEENNISIYPNPSSDFIKLNNIENATEVSIMDIAGKTVKFEKLNSNNTINVADLKNGIYFLKVVTKDNKIINNKFIKN